MSASDREHPGTELVLFVGPLNASSLVNDFSLAEKGLGPERVEAPPGPTSSAEIAKRSSMMRPAQRVTLEATGQRFRSQPPGGSPVMPEPRRRPSWALAANSTPKWSP